MLTIGSRRIVLAVFLVVSLALVAATAAHAHPTFGSLAWARIVNADGDTVGAAILNQRDEEVRVFAWVRGLAPGEHGIHIHAVGRCDDAAFVSAGSHFNPGMKKHGLSNPEGPHAGDLPNLEVKDGGLGILRATTDRVSLGEGPKSLFDSDGSALIVHAAEDDQMTDPTGNSGARIACGVIRAG